MILKNTITILKPIADVWDVLGNDFTNAYRWSSDLKHSEGTGRHVANGVCETRHCDVKGMGKIQEKIEIFDPENHILAYEVTHGFPFFVKRGVNHWTLVSQGNYSTRLEMNAKLETKGLIGAMMAPMMKMQMGGMLKRVAEDFKYYVETGKPHPRKLRAKAR